MRRFTFALFALVLATAFAGAQHMGGQHAMKTKAKTQTHSMGKSMMHNTMMAGLTASEKKTAMAIEKKMTAAEKAVMHKRCMLCMKDNHASIKNMKPTEELMKKHMMSGLTPAEQKTLGNWWSGLSAAEQAVVKKIVTNCCMYGMKHGK